MSEAPKRRWPWLTLPRALAILITMHAVAAAPSSWLAWNLYWMHKREVMLDRPGISRLGNTPPQKDLPLLWKFFGACSYAAVNLDRDGYTEAARDRYAAAFPEAVVTRAEPLELPPQQLYAPVQVPIE